MSPSTIPDPRTLLAAGLLGCTALISDDPVAQVYL
jgi:hypothetical protein